MISQNNILKLKARQVIYEFISKNPGLHQREISRKMNIPKTTLAYHIKFLKKLNLIDEDNAGNSKYYSVTKKMGTKEKQILNLFRKKTPCRILLYLAFSLSCSQIELSRELELPRTTVARNIKKMLDMEIIEEAPIINSCIYPYPNSPRICIEKKPVKSEKFYRRKNQEVMDMTWAVLIAHKDNIADKNMIQAYSDYLSGIGYKDIKKNDKIDKSYKAKRNRAEKKYFKVDYYIDLTIDVVNDIFRPPFCA